VSALATADTVPADDDYAAFCGGVQRISKIDLSKYKRGQMERRIRSFAASRGKSELLDYLALLAHDEGELEHFLHHLTINVSQLWRNPELWRTLAENVIPQIARGGRIRAWSAGCSYGAEAYTLAAVCRDAAPSATLEIRGSDIDERMVEQARLGRFSDDDMRSVPAAARERWFVSDGPGWRVNDELAKLVRFDVEDLLACRPASGAYDLICCRNTVIYFTESSRAALHERLAAALQPGGWLMVGATERIADAAEYGLELIHPFTYRKT
jgi:chemotaxis protein methyltransferase CheR